MVFLYNSDMWRFLGHNFNLCIILKKVLRHELLTFPMSWCNEYNFCYASRGPVSSLLRDRLSSNLRNFYAHFKIILQKRPARSCSTALSVFYGPEWFRETAVMGQQHLRQGRQLWADQTGTYLQKVTWV